MPGFSETAAYFEARAKKARSPVRRQELADAAKFYRTLAQIAPNFPYGYRQPAPVKLNGSRTADRLCRQADECRALAEAMRDETRRKLLVQLAETYEQAARLAEAKPK